MFEEISPNIFFIEGQLAAKYPFSNSLFIKGESENVLIDTGNGPKLLKELQKKFKINKVLLSHNHEDHTCGNKYLKGIPIYVHNLDKQGVESIKYLQYIYGLDDHKYDQVFNAFMQSLGFEERTVDSVFQDKAIFDLGDKQIEVIHTPGHSAGHCCFLIKPNNVLFLSDIDLTSFGPWYGSIDGNVDDFMSSIKHIIEIIKIKNIHTVVSSHKGVFNGHIINKLESYLAKFAERDQKIIQQLNEKQTLDQLTEKALIYGKIPEPKEFFYKAEYLMLQKHLIRLIKNKIVIEKNGYYSANI